MPAPFTRLLLATEHTEFDAGAETLAMALARRDALPLVAVLPILGNPEFDVVAPQLAAQADAEASRRSEALQTLAVAQQVRLEVTARHGPEPDVEIVDEARRRAVDLIVIRRRGKRGFLANLLVGEMVGKVVARAPCSVLIAPRQARMWTRRVMVAIDPQAPSHASLGLAARIAADCALPLHVVCVVAAAADAAQAGRVLVALQHKALAICADVDGEVRIGRADVELVLAAKACAADLLVLSRQHGDRPQRRGIGSTAQKVIGQAECPVLVHVNPVFATGEPA